MDLPRDRSRQRRPGGITIVRGRGQPGALYARDTDSVQLLRCVFWDNYGSWHWGGAMVIDGATLLIEECVFVENTTLPEGNAGGAAAILSSSTEIRTASFSETRPSPGAPS